MSLIWLHAHHRAWYAHGPQSRTGLVQPAFVGSTACAGCHPAEFANWNGSHHQLAMQPATNVTVLGDFGHATYANNGRTTLFYRKLDKFMVSTEGPDGKLHDFPIAYTFGVSPLQQYLIAMPGGRLQALGIAWDSRPRDKGGQHWFQLNPDLNLHAGDPLHWTGIDQNWNFMCADCHSTNVRKNYDPQTRSFATTYAEMNVGCEACHGPGSNHVSWATSRSNRHSGAKSLGLQIALDERRGVSWRTDPASGNVVRSVPSRSEREIQMCARCHSRRGQIHEDYVHGQPVGDDYRVALLDKDLYFPDGQIKNEVYEYGSFIQSRMFHAGVTCSDCHEPHSSRIRAPHNSLCLRCHQAAKYDTPRHHFHNYGSPGARCVECHMPTRTYMVIDARRDHSIRIPRPDLTIRLGVPNACNGCHKDKSVQWAEDQQQKWYGHRPVIFQRFGEALESGTTGAPSADQLLEKVIVDREEAAIARASALVLISERYKVNPSILADCARDNSSLVRRAAAGTLRNVSLSANPELPRMLLEDSVRAVRIEAAESLAGVASDTLTPDERAALKNATAEYVAAQELNSDRPEAHVNLAALYEKEKHMDAASQELMAALALDSAYAPAAVNLADLDRLLGRESDGEGVLRAALTRLPKDASLEHALGLSLIREGHRAEALAHLAAAAQLDPANARFTYVYAVALNDAGQRGKAIEVLESYIAVHPYDCDDLGALESFYSSAGETKKAALYAERLKSLGRACATDVSPQ